MGLSPFSRSPLPPTAWHTKGTWQMVLGVTRASPPRAKRAWNFFLSKFIIRAWADGFNLSRTLLPTSLKERGAKASDGEHPKGAF